MSKKRKYDTDFLKGLIQEYVSQKGGYKKLKYTDIVTFCKDKYMFLDDINYQDFSRNNEIKEYIENYNESIKRRILDVECTETITQDRLIDARELYGKTECEIDKIITNINKYLVEVYADERKIVKSLYDKENKLKKLEKEKNKLEESLYEIQRENLTLKKENADRRKKVSELLEKISVMSNYIEKNIYDPVIQRHLMNIGILNERKENNSVVSTTLMETSLEEIVMNEILTSKESEALDILSRLGETDEKK